MLFILSSENASQVNKILSKQHSIVFYYWSSCGYCRKIMPMWKRICIKYLKSKINIINVEMDQMPLLKAKYKKNISGVPTIIKYVNGKREEEFNDARTFKKLDGFVRK
jgi:thiol-disulfide isomerase/thioredoxin